ncbi:MAG: large-conductance mechanosensitive channel protein MscL [Caulobacterales bacterium]|jgi:large conductance mechanosensitive channel
MLKEFRDFAMRGNVVDLAIGVIIGAAFGAIVSSLVDDVIMPPIGLVLAGLDFSALKIMLKAAVPAIGVEGQPGFAAAKPEVAISIGKFINALIKFTIVAFVLFMIVKATNNMKAKLDAAPAPATPSETLLAEIRDLLKK